MANDLPGTIDDLTDAEFRALMKERMPFMRLSQPDLLWQRYSSLSDEALRLERRSFEAWDAWMAAVDAVLRAHDEAMRVARDRPAAYARANRAYRAAQDARNKAEAARDRADAAAKRMRKRADVVHDAWNAAWTAFRAEQAGG